LVFSLLWIASFDKSGRESCRLKSFNGKKTWFLRLNPESIREVVFGLYTEKKLKEDIKGLIKRPDLKHINLRQAEESEKYTLKLKPIT